MVGIVDCDFYVIYLRYLSSNAIESVRVAMLDLINPHIDKLHEVWTFADAESDWNNSHNLMATTSRQRYEEAATKILLLYTNNWFVGLPGKPFIWVFQLLRKLVVINGRKWVAHDLTKSIKENMNCWDCCPPSARQSLPSRELAELPKLCRSWKPIFQWKWKLNDSTIVGFVLFGMLKLYLFHPRTRVLQQRSN